MNIKILFKMINRELFSAYSDIKSFSEYVRYVKLDYVNHVLDENFDDYISGKKPITRTMLDLLILTDEDVSNVNTSQITDFSYLLTTENPHQHSDSSSFNQDISGWDVSSGTNFDGMFSGASSFNQDISHWNVSKGGSFRFMFSGASLFNQDIGRWDISNAVNLSNMFTDATSFNQDLSKWNTSNVKFFVGMFKGASAFNQDIGNWDVSNGRMFSNMFNGAISFNQDIGGWVVSKAKDLRGIFKGASSFNQDIGKWDVSACIGLSEMFYGAESFNQDLSKLVFKTKTELITDMFEGSGIYATNLLPHSLKENSLFWLYNLKDGLLIHSDDVGYFNKKHLKVKGQTEITELNLLLDDTERLNQERYNETEYLVVFEDKRQNVKLYGSKFTFEIELMLITSKDGMVILSDELLNAVLDESDAVVWYEKPRVFKS